VLATLLGTAPVRGNRLHSVYLTGDSESEDSCLKPKNVITRWGFRVSRPGLEPGMSPTGHTNQIEPDRTKTLNVNGFRKSLSEGEPTNDSLPAEEEIRVGSLVLEMLEVCRDKHSRGFYRLVARNVPEELIRAALSETRYQDRMGRITKSRGAFFTDQLQRIARERGIKIGLKLPCRPDASSASHQR
jgi:hypothetical protein